MEFFITWSDGLGRVGTDSFMYDITEKPEVGFDFDVLYYETPTNLFFKVFEGANLSLTEDEKKACEEYCKDFYNSDAYMIHAIDSDLLTYAGYMARGAAKRNGLTEAIGATFPDYSFCKWINGKWDRVVAAIGEDGSLYLLPTADDQRFNFVFTESEWNQFPHPEYDDEKYNFMTKQWEDTRSFSVTQGFAKERVRAKYLKGFRDEKLVHFEVDTLLYLIQVLEASTWLTNKEAKTPFVEAVIAQNGDTKEHFMHRILQHYDTEHLTHLGTMHGEQYAILDKISACTTLEELDAIMFPIFEGSEYPWRRPMKVDPYATVH